MHGVSGAVKVRKEHRVGRTSTSRFTNTRLVSVFGTIFLVRTATLTWRFTGTSTFLTMIRRMVVARARESRVSSIIRSSLTPTARASRPDASFRAMRRAVRRSTPVGSRDCMVLLRVLMYDLTPVSRHNVSTQECSNRQHTARRQRVQLCMQQQHYGTVHRAASRTCRGAKCACGYTIVCSVRCVLVCDALATQQRTARCSGACQPY